MTEKQLQGYRQLLGKTIRERREAHNQSQEDFGNILKLPRQRISDIERGKTRDMNMYVKYINALGGQIIIQWS